MRKIKSFLTLSTLSLLLLTLATGCLKDEIADDNLANPSIDKSMKLIELAGPFVNTTSYTSTYALSLNSSAVDTTARLVVVRLASDQMASEDIQVTLELAQDLLEAYNDSTGAHYEVPDASLYTLSDLTVTIPKGSREGYVTITTAPEDIAGGEFAFAFRIKAVSNPAYTISGNLNNQVVVVGVKNKYDGVWHIEGSMVDLTNALFTSFYPLTWDLVTNSANSVVVFDNEQLGIPGHLFLNAGSPSYYGNFGLIVNFDPATDKITSVTNYFGQPASNGRSAVLDPTGVNAYMVVDGVPTIKIKYFMLQPGTTVRTTFDETWTYEGPRP
jgi:hypothetical protein